MAETATSDWSSGSAGGDWTQPSGMFGGGMWGAPSPYGMQSPYGGYGMQQPYSSPYSGFGGGMPYGGGYPMQSPYGAYGGYGGGYSPYGMQSPYGGDYGGYSPYGGMQSPYSGMMSSPYAMQAYGMPQTMQATGEAAPAAELTTGEVTPPPEPLGEEDKSNYKIYNLPWGPLASHYENELFPRAAFELREQAGRIIKDADGRVIEIIPGKGPLGFDPSSEAGLARIEAMAGDPDNPLFRTAWDATRNVTSGQEAIRTGSQFGDLYRNPGINNAGQYSEMYQNPGFTVDPYGDLYRRDAVGNAGQYNEMIGRNAIGNEADYAQSAMGIDRFSDLYRDPGVNTTGYANLHNTAGGAIGTERMQAIYGGPGVGTGRMQEIYGGPGISTQRMQDIYGGPGVSAEGFAQIRTDAARPELLSQGMFGQIGRGDLVNANPFREQAIEDAMQQTSDEVKSTMSARGRYGSDAYGDAMGEALGRIATQARMAGYDTDTANMMAAQQARSGEALSRMGVGLQAQQGIAGAQAQNRANDMAAAQSIMGAQGQNIQDRLAAARDIAGAQGVNIANQMGAAQSIMGAQGLNWQNQLAAMQGLTGAQAQNAATQMGAARGIFDIQAQNRQNQLAAAQGISALQGTNAAQRLAQIQGLSGVQGQNYQAQMNALQGMNAAEQMAASQRMAAAQGLTGVQAQNWQNQLGALQGLTDVQGQNLQNQLQAAGMAPTMQQLRYDDTGRLLQAGASREAMAQQQRDFTWDQINQYRNVLGNLPGSAGSQTQDTDKPWWETALGVAGTLGGIFGNIIPGGG